LAETASWGAYDMSGLEKGRKVANLLIMTSAFCSTYKLFYGSSGLEKVGKVAIFLVMTLPSVLLVIYHFMVLLVWKKEEK
jgi:hypothetical protein